MEASVLEGGRAWPARRWQHTATMFDLDKPFDRRGGDSLKWGRYRDSDVIAAWVADMISLPLPRLWKRCSSGLPNIR